jgi:hypothetical protein
MVATSDNPPGALEPSGRLGALVPADIGPGRSQGTGDSGHLLIGDGDLGDRVSVCCAAQLRTQPLAVAWGRHARAGSQPRRDLVLPGVLAEGGD